MGNFNQRFEKQQQEFDKQFARAQKTAIVVSIIAIVVGSSLLCGFIFVVYKVLVHFGIL